MLITHKKLSRKYMIFFVLNIPYTVVGMLFGLVSIPKSIEWNVQAHAIIIRVKKFWWAIGLKRSSRAMTIGHIILLSPRTEEKDLEHEFVHVQQHERMPLIFPILYFIENVRRGYKNNMYEKEAYRIAGNMYYDKN